jgi:hypothetical protein
MIRLLWITVCFSHGSSSSKWSGCYEQQSGDHKNHQLQIIHDHLLFVTVTGLLTICVIKTQTGGPHSWCYPFICQDRLWTSKKQLSRQPVFGSGAEGRTYRITSSDHSTRNNRYRGTRSLCTWYGTPKKRRTVGTQKLLESTQTSRQGPCHSSGISPRCPIAEPGFNPRSVGVGL